MRIGRGPVVLAQPQTYMNESGQAVGPLVRRHEIDDLSRLIVVHDELDLPVGRMKVKSGGGLAGHNGLRSIKSHLHDDGLRPGPHRGGQAAEQGRGRRPRATRPPGGAGGPGAMVDRAADAVEAILADGVEATMNRFNALPDLPPTPVGLPPGRPPVACAGGAAPDRCPVAIAALLRT